MACLGDLADASEAPAFLRARRLAEPLRRVGKNALLLFVLGASGVFDAFLGSFYYVTAQGKPKNVVDYARQDLFRDHVHGSGTRANPHALADLLFSIAIVLFWTAVAWVLDARGLYWTA